MSIITEISAFLEQGRVSKTKELVINALDEGYSAQQIVDEGLLVGMKVISDNFKTNVIFVPDVLLSVRAMRAGMEVLKPFLISENISSKGKAVLGTVKGDLHDIGKNLVKMMFESKGIDCVDLGTDVPPKTFVEQAIKEKADIIVCSALLTTTMTVMKNVVKEVRETGTDCKIMVGGAPISQRFCDAIGADGYAPDAASASDLALQLLKDKHNSKEK